MSLSHTALLSPLNPYCFLKCPVSKAQSTKEAQRSGLCGTINAPLKSCLLTSVPSLPLPWQPGPPPDPSISFPVQYSELPENGPIHGGGLFSKQFSLSLLTKRFTFLPTPQLFLRYFKLHSRPSRLNLGLAPDAKQFQLPAMGVGLIPPSLVWSLF